VILRDIIPQRKIGFTKKIDLPRYNRGRPLQYAGSRARHATALRALVARGTEYERLAVDADDFDRFQGGDSVAVGVEPGRLAFHGITVSIVSSPCCAAGQ